MAELCEFTFRQVSENSRRSDGCFPESSSDGTWPTAAVEWWNLKASTGKSPSLHDHGLPWLALQGSGQGASCRPALKG